MLLVSPVDEVPNLPLLAVQLEIPALLEQDLARVLGILLVLILSEGLIIQNAVRERPRRRNRVCLWRYTGQR